MKGSEIRNALIYLIISLFLAAAGAVYEHFSFGVYSNYMIYAFAIPLIGGTLPQMLIGLRSQNRAAAADGLSEGEGTGASLCGENGVFCGAEVSAEGRSEGGAEESDAENIPVNQVSAKTYDRERFLQAAEALVKSWLYSAALATLTVGSVMKGVLDICGRPNGLTIGYPIAAALLLAAAILCTVMNTTDTGCHPASRMIRIQQKTQDLQDSK